MEGRDRPNVLQMDDIEEDLCYHLVDCGIN